MFLEEGICYNQCILLTKLCKQASPYKIREGRGQVQEEVEDGVI